MDPLLKAMLILAAALVPVAALGFHWAKQEREEFRAKCPIASGYTPKTPSDESRKTAGPRAGSTR